MNERVVRAFIKIKNDEELKPFIDFLIADLNQNVNWLILATKSEEKHMYSGRCQVLKRLLDMIDNSSKGLQIMQEIANEQVQH